MTPRQRRKRKVEAAVDCAHHVNDEGAGWDDGRAEGGRERKGGKRPRRQDHDRENDNGHRLHLHEGNSQNGSHGATNGRRGAAGVSSERAAASSSHAPYSRTLIGTASASETHDESISSASRRLRRFGQVGTRNGDDLLPEVEQDADRISLSSNKCLHSTAKSRNNLSPEMGESDTILGSSYNDSALALDRARRRMKLLLLLSVVNTAMIAFVLSAIIYTQHINNSISNLERNAWLSRFADEQSEIIKLEREKHEQTQAVLKTMHGHLANSEEQILQLQGQLANATMTHRVQIEEYKSIFRRHDEELSGAIERINLLRGDKEASNAAVDQAWLRMDELMEENDELSNDLRQAKREFDDDIARVQLRDKELLRTVETLTRRLTQVSSEKEMLEKVRDDLLVRLEQEAAEYSLLRHNHEEFVETYLAPILAYVPNLQRTSERQHSVILDLTSLVHSLHRSLEVSRSDLETQAIQSMQAVDAVAEAHGLAAMSYEIEREEYMEYMELQLEQLEDEAMGAVQAVAEAAGRMEYERKIEEEGRWRSYTREAESILGGIREKVDGDGGIAEGIGEKSVLRAAISRRIEEGIASLRGYIHPYNYLKGREQTIEVVAENGDCRLVEAEEEE